MKTKIITLILVIFCSMFYGQVVRNTGSGTTTTSTSDGSGSGNGDHNIQLYPTPCTTSLTIKSIHQIASYAIYNEKGQLKYNASASQNVIQIDDPGTQINISAGRYYITVMFDDGYTSTSIFIKTDDQALYVQKLLVSQLL